MKKESTKKTFRMNGWVYTYNEPMTSNWGWPEGRKGVRVRILKKQMLQLLKERDYFKTPYTEEPAEAPQTAEEKSVEEVEEKAPETAQEAAGEATEEEKTGLTISLPRDGFTDAAVENLRKLVDAKAPLIQKALAADRLDIIKEDGKLTFPWWDRMPSVEEIGAYSAFIASIGRMAKEAKRVTAKGATAESEKYAFRCFLLRLGFIGPDSAAHRKILLSKLSGSAAFVSQDKADAFAAAQKAKRNEEK